MAIFRDPCTFEEAVVLNGSVTFADTPTEIVLTNLTALAIGADGAGTAAPALTLKKTAAGTADVAFKAADDLRGRIRLNGDEAIVIETFDANEASTGTITMGNAAGAVAISGTLAVTGNVTGTATITAADLVATDDVTVGDDLTVTGLATIGETLAVTGNITGSATVTGADLVATDDLTVGDDAAIAGALTVGETLAVTGTATMAAINASGTVAAAAAMTVGTTLAIGTGATLGGVSTGTAAATITLNKTAAGVSGLVLKEANAKRATVGLDASENVLIEVFTGAADSEASGGSITISPTGTVTLTGALNFTLASVRAADDDAAAAALDPAVPVGGLYRTGSALKIRAA